MKNAPPSEISGQNSFTWRSGRTLSCASMRSGKSAADLEHRVDAERVAHVTLDAAAAEQRGRLGRAGADEDVLGVDADELARAVVAARPPPARR